MPLDKKPIWAGRETGSAAPATPPPAPRALHPETGEPVPHFNLMERLIMRAFHALSEILVKRWLPRQLLKLLTVAATYIGATESDTAGATAFLIAGFSAGLELVGSILSRRFLKLKS